MKRRASLGCAAAVVAAALSAAPLAAEELVITASGGLLRNTLEEFMYVPFTEATGVEVVPFDIEMPDQWAMVEGMVRSGDFEFDIVTATGPELVARPDILADIPCDTLENVKQYALPGACLQKGIARTTGGIGILFNAGAFPNGGPQSWADFWDVETFPGPRGLLNVGDKDWWVPAIALVADGVPPDQVFPMDIDRAYRKLDEIRPHIAVWTKNGNHLAQTLRDGEVLMSMGWSSRFVQLDREGFPIGMVWKGAVQDTGYFAVLEGSKNKDAAFRFIDFFYGYGDGHPDLIRALGFSTSSTLGMSKLSDDEQKKYPSYPANYEQLLVPDFEWIGANRAELRDRWDTWLVE